MIRTKGHWCASNKHVLCGGLAITIIGSLMGKGMALLETREDRVFPCSCKCHVKSIKKRYYYETNQNA